MRHVLFLLLLLLSIPGELLAKERLVAVILPKHQPRYQPAHDAFLQQLDKTKGSAEVRVYVQTPNPDLMSLRNSARKAVAIGADLIVVYGAMPALAAQAESFNTPIIYADVYDPVSQGLIPSQASAGRNMTGVSGHAPIQTLFKVFLQSRPVSNLAVVYDPNDPTGNVQQRAVENVAVKRGIKLFSVKVDSNQDLIAQLQKLPQGLEAVYLADGMKMAPSGKAVIEQFMHQGVPVISQIPGAADMGAFMTLEEDMEEQGQLVAGLVSRWLAGDKVSAIEPVPPRKIALVVNLNTAKALNITVPFEVLAVTSRVVR